MLNEIYNRIKEQDRFSDVFKPISKEEKEVRLKKRLEESDYEYLYTGDIKGEVIWTYEGEISTDQLANILMQKIRYGYKVDVNVELDVKITNTQSEMDLYHSRKYIVGLFSGNLIAFSHWELDEVVLVDVISDYAYEKCEECSMELSDVEVTNLKEIRKNDN